MVDYKSEGKEAEEVSENKFTNISVKSNIILNVILSILALIAILPFIFVVIISFTDEKILRTNGYSFFPQKFSADAYKYVMGGSSQLTQSYLVTILITVLGTIIGLLFISTFAFVLSRRNFAFKKFFTMVVFIPMLFGGGMVSFYLIMTQVLHLKNTIWALILPLSVNSWYIIILRTFFKTSVPEAVIESAKIDGAGELRIFFQIVLPISLAGIATIALFLTLGYWNDWFNAMLFIDKESLAPLQYMLIRIENNMEFLSNNATKLGVSQILASNSMPKETAKMAMVVLSTAPIIFAYPFFQKYFVSGLTIGAVKE